VGGALAGASPESTRVLVVESAAKLSSKRWHIQRAHLVLSGLRHLAADLRERGFEVDYRRADSLRSGLRAHLDEFHPE
jgi:deoxyribodipyrimidine photolyase-related protein